MDERCLECLTELPPASRAAGQRRLYCGSACRQVAYRRRRSARALLPPDTLDLLVDFAFVDTPDPLAAAAEVQAMLMTLGHRCRRLAVVAPKQIAWREERTAQAIAALLRDFWPPVD
jgi:hypothetical protein